MKIVNNFYNKLTRELDGKYFPTVEYYRDNKKCTNVHYAVELFNNGCLTYTKLISKLSIACNDTKENIEAIVYKYVIVEV